MPQTAFTTNLYRSEWYTSCLAKVMKKAFSYLVSSVAEPKGAAVSIPFPTTAMSGDIDPLVKGILVSCRHIIYPFDSTFSEPTGIHVPSSSWSAAGSVLVLPQLQKSEAKMHLAGQQNLRRNRLRKTSLDVSSCYTFDCTICRSSGCMAEYTGWRPSSGVGLAKGSC